MRIGVLAVQGAFAEHLEVLRHIGVDGIAVRLPAHLDGISGLILPGGESTAIRKLIDRWGLRGPIMDLASRGAPLFGTCAGMILLSREIVDGDAPVLPLLDVAVKRNAFGRQLDSFEADMHVPVLGDQPVHGVFIRAPVIVRVGPGVDVLARLDDGRVVAVRERNIVATAFHPELAGETRFHRLIATMAGAYAEPDEGSGRRHHPTRRAAARSDGSGSGRTDALGSARTDAPGPSRTDGSGSSRTDGSGSARTDAPGPSRSDGSGFSRTDAPGSSRSDRLESDR